jgi:hypothetical protein
MCHSPVVLAMVSCEEAIMYSVSQLFQRAGNGLAKAFLIVKFVDQLLVLISIARQRVCCREDADRSK